uniref:flavin reductase family protein n=1 Tax=Eshraghiella crossota TaxID=45851 RepID=UPI004025AB17
MSKQSWKPGNMLYPLPVVMVSCNRKGEKPNIVTVAWTGTICSDPAMVSISVRPERYSHDIIEETGEFVINLVTKDLTYATDYCGVRSGRDVDKFKEMNLTPLPSKMIDAVGIEDSPVNIECKVVEVKKLGSHDMFIAEVVNVTVDDRYM